MSNPEPTPWKDPIVEEVRKARREYLAQCGNNLDRMFDDLRRREAQRAAKPVTLDPRPVDKTHQRRRSA